MQEYDGVAALKRPANLAYPPHLPDCTPAIAPYVPGKKEIEGSMYMRISARAALSGAACAGSGSMKLSECVTAFAAGNAAVTLERGIWLRAKGLLLHKVEYPY